MRELLGGTVIGGTDGLDEWGGREVFRFRPDMIISQRGASS